MQDLPEYSYSKVKLFYDCPYSFFQRYCDDIDESLTVSNGAAEFGTFVHKILELYANGLINKEEMLNYYYQNFSKEIKSSFVLKLTDKFSKNLFTTYFESGEKYIENFDEFKDFSIIEAEYEFKENILDSFILHGKIDLIARDKNNDLVIIDHKSKGKFKKGEKEEYAKQLYLYALAVKRKYGEYPKYLFFNMFRTQEMVKIEFDIDEYNKVLKWFTSCVDEIENAFDFTANKDTFFCRNFCDFRKICKYR